MELNKEEIKGILFELVIVIGFVAMILLAAIVIKM